MAVDLEFINLLIRIDAIEARYEGGWEQFKKDHEMEIGSSAWYDDHLFRTGAMSPGDLESSVDHYISRGLQLWHEEDGEPVEWIDGCASDIFGPTLRCEWLDYVEDGSAAFLKGTDPGQVITRSDFPAFDMAEWYRTH